MRIRALVGAALGAVLLSGCYAECDCVAPFVDNPPAAATNGASLKVHLGGLYATCCDTGGRWPWSAPGSDPMSSVTVQLVDNNGEVLDEETVDVADDATATVTFDVPADSASLVSIDLGGSSLATLPVLPAVP